MLKAVGAVIASVMLIASAACVPEENPDPKITIKPPKYSERPKNKDKRHSNKPKPRITPPCSPGDKRWVCPK